MHAYTLGAVLALALVVIFDLFVLRTKVVKTAQFWITALIVSFFQIFVDGWLTKLSSPIVQYSPHHLSGIRVFFSSPVEDFIYGLALLLLTVSIWKRLGSDDGAT
ncbi:MAG: lycopene cyclase domain-containing protein [Acidimicrobiales bacterium]